MIKKYLVKLSNTEVPIDEDEVSRVVMAISSGRIVRVRQGIINPSFFSGIVLDEKRIRAYYNENQYKKTDELPPIGNLVDIFEGIDLSETRDPGRKELAY